MSISIQIPEKLYRLAAEIADAEKISVDELIVSAFETRLQEFERLRQRASHGSHEKFRRVMSGVPAVEPSDHDRL